MRGVCQPTWEFKSPLSHQLVGASFISLAPAFYAYGKKVRVRSFRCSSSQTRTHFVGLRVCVLWSSLCDRAFYFPGNRKHHPLRSLAPPFQIEPVLCTGLRFGFLCPKLKNMLLLFEQASYRLLRLFMPMAKKSECAHSAAPPPKPGPADVGLRVCFLRKAAVLRIISCCVLIIGALSEQALYRLLLLFI